MSIEVKAEFRERITGLTFDRKSAVEQILYPDSYGESQGAIERLSDTLDTVVEVLARLIAMREPSLQELNTLAGYNRFEEIKQ